jgi:hypothetical protein
MASEGMPDIGGGGVCGLSGLFSFCSKAARSAAWAGVSSARTEKKLAPRATHKPKKILIFMKLSIFIALLRASPRPINSLSLAAKQFFSSVQTAAWDVREPVEILLSEKVRRLNLNIGECPNNIHEYFWIVPFQPSFLAAPKLSEGGSLQPSTVSRTLMRLRPQCELLRLSEELQKPVRSPVFTTWPGKAIS